MSDTPFQVLMVCTGNICRSPMMERILQQAFDRRGAGGEVVVRSAGTWAHSGEPMQPFATDTLTERGVDAEGFSATSLSEELVRSSDLVVTATREHRSQVVGLCPGAVRRTFTLFELARVAATAPTSPHLDLTDTVERVRQRVAWAARMRGSVSRDEDSVDDLDDPLGAPLGVYRERAGAITGAVEQIVPFLIGGQGANPAG